MAACWMLSKRHISISKLALARPDPWATWLALTSAPSALHDQVMNSRWSHGLAANFASLCVAVSARSRARLVCLAYFFRCAAPARSCSHPDPPLRDACVSLARRIGWQTPPHACVERFVGAAGGRRCWSAGGFDDAAYSLSLPRPCAAANQRR